MKNKKRAYTLIELSIVVLIVSILISGGMSALTSSANKRNIQLTEDRLARINQAMGAYLLNHKSLPCPASIEAIKSSNASYGLPAGVDGDCITAGVTARGASLVYGAVPTQTLGLSAEFAEDGFGDKITYVVAKNFTNPDAASSSSFGRATATGIISVYSNIEGSLQIADSDVIYVLISHGVNKEGAFPTNSSVRNPIPMDSDENMNCCGSDNNFVKVSENSDVFDDIMLHRNRNELVLEFDALETILCNPAPAEALTDGIHTWPSARYNQIVASDQACNSPYDTQNQFPLKKCDALGEWQSGVTTDCH